MFETGNEVVEAAVALSGPAPASSVGSWEDSAAAAALPSVRWAGAVGGGRKEKLSETSAEFVLLPGEKGIGKPQVEGLPVVFSVGDGEILKKRGKKLPPGQAKDKPRIRVTAVTDETSMRLGMQGLGYRLEVLDADLVGVPLVVLAEISYADLAVGQSMDWVHRVQLVQTPDCLAGALTESSCSDVRVLAFENDPVAQTMVAEFVVGGIDEPSPVKPTDLVDPALEVPAGVPEVSTDPGSWIPPEVFRVAEPSIVAPVVEESLGDLPGANDLGGSAHGLLAAGSTRRSVPRRSTGSGGSTYGLSAGYSSNYGSYTATPVSSAASWAVGLQSGSFDWSYAVPAVPVAFGGAPSFSLSYSSGAVDGLVADENTQPPVLGAGWSLNGGGFIERSYRSCSQDGWAVQDLCWYTDPTTGRFEYLSIVLNGRSAELVAVGPDEYRLKDDPGWRVRKFYGAGGSPDNNGEFFEVTSADGTVSTFGKYPSVLNSTWDVPVFANHPGEPCYPNGCIEGWRWMLDNVVDIRGNVTEYHYVRETNSYGLFGLWQYTAAYTRGGYLDYVDYGRNDASGTSQYRARLDMHMMDRCWQNAPTLCQWSDPSPWLTAPWYLDSPTDLECSANCTKAAPSFFTKKSLKDIYAQVFVPETNSFRTVDDVRLDVQWPDYSSIDAQPAQMWTQEIDRNGYSSVVGVPGLSMPNVKILREAVPRDNRADGVTHLLWRVESILNETGEKVSVTYGQPHGCDLTPYLNGSSWATNTHDCYPRWTTQDGATGWGTFNKFLVTSITRTDTTSAGSPAHRQLFQYVDSPAFHHNDDPLTVNRTWSEWRGHGQVVVQSVAADGVVAEQVEHRFFRGMNGDSNGAGGVKAVAVDIGGESAWDEWFFRGREHSTFSMNGGIYERKEFTTFWGYNPGTGAVITAADRSRSNVYHLAGFWIESLIDQDSDGFGNVRWVREDPDTSSVGGERCRQIEFAAPNYATWVVSAQVATVMHEGDCAGGWKSWTHTAYDCDDDPLTAGLPDCVASYGIATKGIVGMTRAYAGGDAALASSWKATSFRYNSAGQITSANGPRSDVNDVVMTSYDTFYGYAKVAANTVWAAGVTTILDPGRMVPLTVTDQNGKITEYAYDALGRLISVWTPDENRAAGAAAAVIFSYGVSQAAASWVKTSVLQDTRRLNSWVLYDGLGQLIQEQRPSPLHTTGAPRSIVSFSSYDFRGLLTRQIAGAVGNVAASSVRQAVPASPIRETRATYDSLRRPILHQEYSNSAFMRQTWIGYYGRDTVIQPPAAPTSPPSSPTSNVIFTDGFGRVNRTETRAPGTITWRNTTYDVNDHPLSTIDQDNVLSTATYNWLGLAVTVTDPNSGTTTFEYDQGGNRVGVNDGRTGTDDYWTRTVLDVLNRPVAVNEQHASPGSIVRPVSGFAYDGPGVLGQLLQKRSYNNGVLTLTTDFGSFDNRYRPQSTVYTVASVPGWTDNGLAGSYTFGATFDKADRQKTLTYPGVPGTGLPAAETVTSVFDAYGNPDTLGGYVRSSDFNADGTIASRQLGAASQFGVKRGYQWDAARGELVRLYAERQKTNTATVVVQDLSYLRDVAGNVVAVTNNLVDAGGVRQGECFGFDNRNRLTAAYTTPSVSSAGWVWDASGLFAANVGAPPSTSCSGPSTGGLNPYASSFSFTPRDRFVSGPAGVYSYNHTAHPDAPSSIVTVGGVDMYSYDTAGNRTVYVDADGPDASYVWDSQGRLVSTTVTGGLVTASLYDVDRQRVLRREPDGTVTLYLAGRIEVVRAAGALSAKRFYELGGTSVAYRNNTTAATGLYWVLGEGQGSASVTVRASSGTTSVQQYSPYGAIRGSGFDGSGNPGDHGFLNQTKDNNTGLNYLNNRYHDPTTGTFLSVDPLVGSTGQPYLYGNGNPVTFSDPTGLSPQDACAAGAKTSGCGGSTKPFEDAAKTRGTVRRVSANTDFVQQTLSSCFWDPGVCTRGRAENPGAADLYDFVSDQLAMLLGDGFLTVGPGGLLGAGFGLDIADILFSVSVGGEGSVTVAAALLPIDRSWRAFTGDLLTVVGLGADLVAIGGLATCAITAGAGCGVAGTAGLVGAAAAAGSAGLTCTGAEVSGQACGFAIGGAALSILPLAGGEVLTGAITRAGRWDEFASLYRQGDFMSSAMLSVPSAALAFGVYDDHATNTHVRSFTYPAAG